MTLLRALRLAWHTHADMTIREMAKVETISGLSRQDIEHRQKEIFRMASEQWVNGGWITVQQFLHEQKPK